MKSLALRDWTMEIVQQKPVLLLRPKGIARGSIEIDEIKSIKVIDPDTGEVVIQTALSTMNGQPLPYTTRNVEHWPSLDPHVFQMFGIHPTWLSEDHEYHSWNPEQAQLLRAPTAADLRARAERLSPSEKRLWLFEKIMEGQVSHAIDWVNRNFLAEHIVSIYPIGPHRVMIIYRAYEEIE